MDKRVAQYLRLDSCLFQTIVRLSYLVSRGEEFRGQRFEIGSEPGVDEANEVLHDVDGYVGDINATLAGLEHIVIKHSAKDWGP